MEFKSPYETLGNRAEEVDGTFYCQSKGCYRADTDAKLIASGGKRVLSWTCADGHENKVPYDG